MLQKVVWHRKTIVLLFSFNWTSETIQPFAFFSFFFIFAENVHKFLSLIFCKHHFQKTRMDFRESFAALWLWDRTEARFFVPDWGDKVDYGIGLSYWPVFLCSLCPQGYIGWRIITTTLCHSQLYPPSPELRIWLRESHGGTTRN